ncbi:FAD-binding oxidoreductase [Thiomicrorhabdus sediminis]|uniref:FAD-binding oxidoreductase n=1 Tax=Thiomicrorhabdus sediminis TaxID=2580412 RepID=A0A4P9K6P2_9GAMM|nr:FAD-binding oxidoreductase [Thiomicrorhabdus sediminis]QCU90679.1 FAD-binding oxidoreductase [Thiomicrorhabdus sediminis]
MNHVSKISGWGRYPQIDSQALPANSMQQVQLHIAQSGSLLARGLGRSYGDSSLSERHIPMQRLDYFIDFDDNTGDLLCSAGVSLAEILEHFVPLGWFLPVTPGTQFVTIGGAIASDVHGKNHHLHGSFCEHINFLKICLANGEMVRCSANENSALFHATCGGMGLTGIIVEASLRLIPINNRFIAETTLKTANLSETLQSFEQTQDFTYSVAWIDCLAKGANLGRSLIMLGEHAGDEADQLYARDLSKQINKGQLSMPFNLPQFTLNRYSIKAFNSLYYHRVTSPKSERIVDYQPYFYPLDKIAHWNRMYGKSGFVQYQFVIPKEAGQEGLHKILHEIAQSQRGSFLAVLKLFGKGNDNLLSFPQQGYTLALDFKLDNNLFAFLQRLDAIVLDYGGRIYLTKDARMSEQTFKQSYPRWQEFQEVREHYGALEKFNSLQSQRLGL